MNRNNFGPHLMVDLNDCDEELSRSIQNCWNFLYELPEKIGMTKITQPHVFPYKGLIPEDEGVTGVVIIAESHISVHTFPVKKYVFIDVFSCKPFDTEQTKLLCVDYFKSKDPIFHTVSRGIKFPL